MRTSYAVSFVSLNSELNFALDNAVLYEMLCYIAPCCDGTVQIFDGLVQERCNSSVLAMELRLSCTNLSIWK